MKNLVLIFALLMTLACCTSEADRERMRIGLDSINERNRNDQPFMVADVEPYVQFFNDQGTPNERLLAYYLLGRAYHDHGEAPMALECYQKAAECADTLSTDCDYPQLARVYGQMAQIFYEQGLYRQQLCYDELSVKEAWKGKDTLLALRNYEQESQAYRNLKIPDSLLYICEHVYKLYRKYGYTHYAARALFHSFSTLIHRQEFDKVRKNMQIYESESELFDSLGNIQKGREIYYKIKGLYFLYTNVLDSAEYYFRKELCDGKNYSNQNSAANGLALLYDKTHHTDSAAKYALYAYTMQDSFYAQRATKEVERIQSLYDYSRNQAIAEKEKEKASDRLFLIFILIGTVSFLLALSVIAILKYREIKQKRTILEEKYQQSLDFINEAQKDISSLKRYQEQNQELILEKEKLIREQEIIRNTMLQNEKTIREAAQKQFNSSAIFRRIIKLADSGTQPTKSEWQELQDALFGAYPNFSDLMTRFSQDLDDREYKVCILIRAGISPGAIAAMLGILSSIVTKTRITLLLKLFGKHGTSKEFDTLLKRIY
jgi:hypothetical protein